MKLLVFTLFFFFLSREVYAEVFVSDKTITGFTSDTQVFGQYGISLTINSGGSIETEGDSNAVFQNGFENNVINVYGKVASQSASAIILYSANSSINLRNNTSNSAIGIVSNNSSVNSTVHSKSEFYSLSSGGGGDIFKIFTTSNTSILNLSDDSSATSYAIMTENVVVSIDNAGKISGPNGIYINVSSSLITADDAVIINRGIIESTFANLSDKYAIKFVTDAAGSITNYGTISGNIDLGSNAGSFIKLEAGIIAGNITLGNASQTIDINGGSFSGAIEGTAANQGTINVNNNFTLNSSSSFGSVNGVGTVNIQDNSILTAQGLAKINALNIEAGSTLNLESSNFLATTTSLGGVLNFGEGSHNFTGNIAGSGNGTLNLNSGSQTITGNLTLNAGDTLGVTFASNGSFGNVTTTGAANVSADAKIAVTIGAAYTYLADGSQYKIIDGSTGSNVNSVSDDNIKFNNSNSNQAFSILKFSSKVVNSEDLYLEVSRASASFVTSNANARVVYDNLNTIGSAATGNLASFQQYLDTSNSQAEITAALKSATPQSDDGIRQTSLNLLNSSFRNIENRLDQLHRKSFESANDNANETIKNFNAWAQTFGTDAAQKQISDNSEGYNSNSNGVILGFDAAISKRTNVGLAVSFANSNIKALDGLKKTNIETYQISAYSGYVFSKYFLDTMASFAINNYSSSRAINSIGVNANASFKGETYSAKVRSGFIQKLNNSFSLVPETSLTFSNNSTNGYLEENAGTMNLNVESNQSNFLEGRVGLNLVYKTITKNGFEISPQLKTSYGYDFVGKRQSTISNFSGQSASFTTQSAKYDRSSLRLGGAVDFYKTNSVTLSGEYTLEKKSQYQSHSAFFKGNHWF